LIWKDGELRGLIQRGPEITGPINAHGQDQDCQAQLKAEVETLDNSAKHSQISSICKVDKQSYNPSLEFGYSVIF
jgi:hypothetical protein